MRTDTDTQGAGALAPRGEGPCADVRIVVPARAENVPVVRQVVVAVAQASGIAPHVRDDIRLAVSEACTNAVRHAYDDPPGLVDVAVRTEATGLEIVVRDHGRGIAPRADGSGPGFGLPLIAAVADRLDVEHAPGVGCQVTMRFGTRRLTVVQDPGSGVAGGGRGPVAA